LQGLSVALSADGYTAIVGGPNDNSGTPTGATRARRATARAVSFLGPRRNPPADGPGGRSWQDHRNKHHAKANWQFKTADARVKLERLYPQFG
jgi:hypothetical protein